MDLSNGTIAIIMVAAAALLLFRIISRWRGVSFRKQQIDWDQHFIQGLRKAGVDTFSEHVVDFFFTVPTRDGATALASALREEGYETDVIEARETSGQFSVHGSRRMRLIVPDMQQLTVHLTQLAGAHGGQYDNWAVVTK
jgi:hypothetical protein